MAVEGSLDLFSLPEILQLISQQGKTGILTVQGQQDIVAVSFLLGKIVAADSLAHTVEEGLSKVLVSEGILGAADFARANAENHAAGARLLDYLVERRYLTRTQLLAALRLQTVRLLETLLRWQEGDFKFYGGDEVSYEEGFAPISVEDLLLRMLAEHGAPPPAPPPRVRRVAPAGERSAHSARGGGMASGDVGLPAIPALPELPELPMPGPPPVSAGRPLAVVPPPPPPPASQGAAAALPLAATAAAAAASAEPAAARRPTASTTLTSSSAGTAATAGTAASAPTAVSAPTPPTPSMPPMPPIPSIPAKAASTPGAGVSPAAAFGAVSSAGPAEPIPWPAAVFTPPPPGANTAARPRAGAGVQARGPGRPGSGGGAPPAQASPATPAGVEPAQVPARAGGGAALPKKFRQMQIERPDVPLLPRLAVACLALALAASLVAVVRRVPQNLILPFPWEQAERNAFVRNQRESLFYKIDGAAKTAFLRDGRFPDSLAQLCGSGLLAPADPTDPRGEPLLYSAREDSYTLQATDAGKPLADAGSSESIAGNFLLDPSLFQTKAAAGPPIVLLD